MNTSTLNVSQEINLYIRIHNTLKEKSTNKIKELFEAASKQENIQDATNNQILKVFFNEIEFSPQPEAESIIKEGIISIVKRKVVDFADEFYEKKLNIHEKKQLLKDISTYLETEIYNQGLENFLEKTNILKIVDRNMIEKKTYEKMIESMERSIEEYYKNKMDKVKSYLKRCGIEKIHNLHSKLQNNQQQANSDKDIAKLLKYINIEQEEIENVIGDLKHTVERHIYRYYIELIAKNYQLYHAEIEQKVKSKYKGETIEKHEYKEGFGYIKSSPPCISVMIMDIKKNGGMKEKSFLDIGCGIPMVSHTMKDRGCKKVAGLEYNKILVEEAIKHYPEIEMHHGDMLTFSEYNKYDILYAYNPIKDREIMAKALCHIIENMKTGATFYFNNVGVDPKKLIKSGFEKVTVKNGSSIYKYTKTTNQFPKEILTEELQEELDPNEVRMLPAKFQQTSTF